MTPFRRLGLVRSFTIFGRTFVSWTENKAAEQFELASRTKDRTLTVARPHE